MNVSIMGDSISTYKGYTPKGYAVYYDDVNAALNKMFSVYDVWWAKVNQFLKAFLCVNNSFSGSKVSGNAFPAMNSEERTLHLHKENDYPDIILVYGGFNDYGYGVPVWNECGFFYSYKKMISQMQKIYPRAHIICATLMKSHIKDNPGWVFPENIAGVNFNEYNNAIRKACIACGCVLADIANKNLTYETLDGTHPTNKGHQTLADSWISCLKR